jgi:hypothetical protein
MINLFEIMQGAQGGNAYQNLANQFGIGQQQAQQAVEAVLPAISLGLQQQAQTIEGWQNILSTLGQSQNSAQFYDSDGDGIPDHLESEGRNALGSMFGGPDMTQAITQQAAQFAGLPASMMQQMMPVIAAMIMGGLFKGASNSGLGGILGQMMQGGAAPGGLGGMLGGMFGQGMGQQNPGPQNPGNVFGNVLGGMFGGQPQPQQQPGGLGGIFGTILNSMVTGGRPPEPPPQADPMAASLEMLKGMFETGKHVQSTQMSAWQDMFSQLSRPKDGQ